MPKQADEAILEEVVAPKKRGRQPKTVVSSPQHEARLAEKSEAAQYLEGRIIQSECYYIDGAKLKKAKFDIMGNMKTEYVLNIAKKKEAWNTVKALLAKATGRTVGYLENPVLLKEPDVLKGYLLKPGTAGF